MYSDQPQTEVFILVSVINSLPLYANRNFRAVRRSQKLSRVQLHVLQIMCCCFEFDALKLQHKGFSLFISLIIRISSPLMICLKSNRIIEVQNCTTDFIFKSQLFYIPRYLNIHCLLFEKSVCFQQVVVDSILVSNYWIFNKIKKKHFLGSFFILSDFKKCMCLLQ